jgi:hypothetical protein
VSVASTPFAAKLPDSRIFGRVMRSAFSGTNRSPNHFVA